VAGKIDYRKIIKAPHRLVLFGEWQHSVESYKYEMVRIMPQLKAMGFTHFGLEMLPTSLQPGLNRGEIAATEKHLNEWWEDGYSTQGAFIHMVNAAHAVGMTVLALDIPYDDWPDQGAHNARNANMAAVLADTVNSGHRVVAYMAYAHAWSIMGVKDLLRGRGLNPLFIKFDGGIANEGVSDLATTARSEGVDKTDFISPGLGGLDADVIIHMRQTERWY